MKELTLWQWVKLVSFILIAVGVISISDLNTQTIGLIVVAVLAVVYLKYIGK